MRRYSISLNLVPKSPITIKGGGVSSLFDLMPQAVDRKRAAEVEDAFLRHFGASPPGTLVGFGGTKSADEDWDYSTCCQRCGSMP
jgi:hypothetical protein